MDAASFSEALDFAIGREQAAVEFYRELAALAAFSVQRSTLTEFMAMEEGHVAMLSSMKARGGLQLSASLAIDLGLAKALAADEKPTAGMSFQDILVAAVKKEERSGELYESLAAASLNPDAKAVFERLVAEESRHKHYFEELYERNISRDN